MLSERICLRRAAIYCRPSPKDFTLLEYWSIRKGTLLFFSTRPLGLRKRTVNLKHTWGLRMFLRAPSLRSSRCSVVQFRTSFYMGYVSSIWPVASPLIVCVVSPLQGRGEQKYVVLRVFRPRGPKTTCFYVVSAPGGPKHVFLREPKIRVFT